VVGSKVVFLLQDQSIPTKVQTWLAENPGKGARVLRWWLTLYHQRLPASFRPMAIAHWISKTSLAASAPALAFYFYNSISLVQAVGASSAIFVASAIVGVFDKASKEKKNYKGDPASETVIRVGELLAFAKAVKLKENQKDDAIRAALGVIEIFARQVTGGDMGSLGVAIALYEGNSRSRLRIRHRNPGNTRPTNKEFDGAGVMGHYACGAGKNPRVVHDLRGFEKSVQRSPTQSAATYRSFLILPLVSVRSVMKGSSVSYLLMPQSLTAFRKSVLES